MIFEGSLIKKSVRNGQCIYIVGVKRWNLSSYYLQTSLTIFTFKNKFKISILKSFLVEEHVHQKQ